MATQPTNMPVPSESPRDLKFNAGKIDEFVTSNTHEYVDRFGDKHRTIDGINYDANQAMLNYGYITKKSFEIGATLNTPNTVLQWESNGEFYRWDGDWTLPKVVPVGSTPESTGGIGVGQWVCVSDASLRSDLATESGSQMINTPDGTVEDRLNTLYLANSETNKKIVTTIIPCAIPTVGNGMKAIVKMSSDDDFYVITKRANGKPGFIAIRITNDVSPTDDNNYGGASPFRPGSVDRVNDAIYAKLAPYNKSEGVTLSTLTPAQIAILYGFTTTGSSIDAYIASGDFTLSSPQVYNVPNNEFVTYQIAASNKAIIRLGCSNGASSVINIGISRDGVNWLQQKTINTKLPQPGQNPIPMDVYVDGFTGTWYLKVSNDNSNPIYLVGLNVLSLGGECIYDYDCFTATITPSLSSGVSYYLGGVGATEFAAREKSTGKFFGTYHGGHSDFLQRLRTDLISYDLESSTAPVLLLTRQVTLHSSSKITTQSSAYSYVASTQIGDGVTVTNYSLQRQSGNAVLCERIFTHMATSARNFDWIHLPVLINKTDDGDIVVGQCGFIQQFRSTDAAYINCYFSQVNIGGNGYGGGYVSFQPNYNKQYYGPAFSSTAGVPLSDGTYTTCKEFF